jgi:hypothetical protein
MDRLREEVGRYATELRAAKAKIGMLESLLEKSDDKK